MNSRRRGAGCQWATVWFVIAAGHHASAATIRVPADFTTIQSAINSAASGDTVLVSRGTYYESIDFDGKSIALISELGARRTTIDAEHLGTVIRMESGEGSGTLVQGFTIRGGSASFGAGVYLLGTAPTFRHNVFIENWQGAGGFGAGIAGFGASPLIEGNEFSGNTCDSQHLSGVLSFVNGSSPIIVNNVIHDNACRAINMTLPVGNAPLVFNNTIVRNRVGIHVDNRVPVAAHTYRNNIIVGNQVGLEVAFPVGDFDATWTHNIVSSNSQQFTGVPDLNGTDGNLDQDPMFANPIFDNFRLASGSPAIDAGSAAGLPMPSTDFDGGRRVSDGDGDSSALPDIGAFEAPGLDGIFFDEFESRPPYAR